MSKVSVQRVETGQRLKKARFDAGYTAEMSAGEMEVSTQTVFNWESGRQFPEPAKLAQLATTYGVSVDYLLGLADEEPQRPVARMLRELTERFEMLELVEVPILGVVPAGEPIIPIGVTGDYIEIPAYLVDGVEEPFALRIAGTSLSDMDIHDGQIAVVDPDAKLVDGKVYVVQIDDEVTAKRVYREDEALRLEGACGDIEVSDSTQVKILGRVVGAGSWRAL